MLEKLTESAAAQQRIANSWIELATPMLDQLGTNGIGIERLAVRPVRCHGVDRVSEHDDSRREGNTITRQPIRVASPIPVFVMMPYGWHYIAKLRHF